MDMKYVVSGGVTLSFPDGTRFGLSPGIHDGSAFPERVKKHWAFTSYVKPLDESELAKEAKNADMAARVKKLEGEITGLTKKLSERDASLDERNTTITKLEGEIADLKVALAAAGSVAGSDGSPVTPEDDGVRNAKKQQAAN